MFDPILDRLDRFGFSAEGEATRRRDFRIVRRLIYLYFILLLVEGVLRKWVLPQLSGPLLIVRDPVVILAYLLALRSGFFPWNAFVVSGLLLGLMSLAGGLLVEGSSVPVALYGFRTDFLQIPFLFLMQRVLGGEDVARLGRWILVATIPVALLMLAQYLSPPTSFINTSANNIGSQLEAIGDRIRPPGPFSFITGVSEFFTLAMAFVMGGLIDHRRYPLQLVVAAGGAMILGTIVSISRLTIACEAIVVLSFFIACLFRPGLAFKFAIGAVFGIFLFLVLGRGGMTADALDVFSQRVELASDFEEQTGQGTSTRVALMFTEPLLFIERMPWLGQGLGTGTNAGAALATGHAATSEGEWGRVVLESGPILGCGFLLWRVLFLLYLGAASFRLCAHGYMMPFLLCGASAYLLLVGQWGRPTTLGFSIFSSGLCLASMAASRRLEAARVAALREAGL